MAKKSYSVRFIRSRIRQAMRASNCVTVYEKYMGYGPAEGLKMAAEHVHCLHFTDLESLDNRIRYVIA